MLGSNSNSLEFKSLGLIGYEEARAIQNKLLSDRLNQSCSDTIIFCEHPPTITIGISGLLSDLLVDQKILKQRGIELIKSDRGGKLTAHEPGQLVIYPVIDLRNRKLSAKCAADILLKSISGALLEIGVKNRPSTKPPGVFTPNGKIAAIGRKIIKGITNHGLAVNILNPMEIFNTIVPCGSFDIGMTSVKKELGERYSDEGLISNVEKHLRLNLNPLVPIKSR